MDEDDVVARQFLAPVSRPADEVAVVNDKLEIELGCLRAGVARAARRVLDAREPPAEAEIALFDRVEQHRGVYLAVEGIRKGGVPLELVHELDRRIEVGDLQVRDYGVKLGLELVWDGEILPGSREVLLTPAAELSASSKAKAAGAEVRPP